MQLAVFQNLFVTEYVSILDSVYSELNTMWGEIICIGVQLATTLFLAVARTIYSNMECSNKWFEDFSDDMAADVFSILWNNRVVTFMDL
jgi:hypothetical protein